VLLAAIFTFLGGKQHRKLTFKIHFGQSKHSIPKLANVCLRATPGRAASGPIFLLLGRSSPSAGLPASLFGMTFNQKSTHCALAKEEEEKSGKEILRPGILMYDLAEDKKN
jgi:hypothetical protein